MKAFQWLVLATLLGLCPVSSPAQTNSIDFNKARLLFERQKSGGTLTDDEKDYLQRARAERERQQRVQPPGGAAAGDGIDWEKARGLHQRDQRGEKLTPDEQSYLQRARAALAARNGGGGGGAGGRPANQRKAPERITTACIRATRAGRRWPGCC